MEWTNFFIYVFLGCLVYYLAVLFYFHMFLAKSGDKSKGSEKENTLHKEAIAEDQELTIKTKY